MPESVTNCPLCEQESSTIFDQRDFRGFKVVNVLCSNCGLIYQTPRMTGPELEDFYQAEYREIYQGSQGPCERDLIVQKARADRLVNFLKQIGIDKVNRFADIGSSSGLLMEKVQKAYNCQVVGFEPGAAYREFAQSKGFTVYDSLVQGKEAEEQRFDLVSMIHVLEHIPDPVDYLKGLRENHLTHDAILLIEVPNLYAHDCFEVAHLTSFSRQTLIQVMNKAGFRTRIIETHGHPRSKLIPLYITLLAEPCEADLYQDNIGGERLVRLKRRAGFFHRRVIERFLPNQGWIPEYRS